MHLRCISGAEKRLRKKSFRNEIAALSAKGPLIQQLLRTGLSPYPSRKLAFSAAPEPVPFRKELSSGSID
jgi:hypothetical protein